MMGNKQMGGLKRAHHIRYSCLVHEDSKFFRRLCGLSGFPFLLILLFPQFLCADGISEKSFQEKFFQPRNENIGVEVLAFADPEQVKPGKNFHVRLRVSIPDGWHIYSMKLEDASLATVIRYEDKVFPILRGWEESQPRIEMDEVLQKMVKSHSHYAEFNILQKAPGNLPAGVYPIGGTVVYHACDNRICTLPKELPFKTQIRVDKRR